MKMKIKTLIKALYFSNPSMFGYDDKYPYTVIEIYNSVIKNAKIDNCKHIALFEDTGKYVERYINDLKNDVQDWNKCTRIELIKG